MNENWYIDTRVVEELHKDLRRAAEQRRLVRSIQQKAHRPRRLSVILALLGMQ